MNNKPLVFISHLHDDRTISLTIQQIIEEKLANAFEIFNSSNPKCIPIGRDWRLEIQDNLSKAKFCLVIYTPRSIHSQWVQYKSGIAEYNGATLLLCLTAGATVDDLP